MYTLGVNLKTQSESIVRLGHDDQNRKVVVKMKSKLEVYTPEEVEQIYREYSFLSHHTKHPNIVRAVDLFHTNKQVYTVLEFAGSQNLSQYLSAMAHRRMREDEAVSCFNQLASALQHCHDKDISHRSISLEHVVMDPQAGSTHPIPKLVDFREALVAKNNSTSTTSCGRLPCMSPEMLIDVDYFPKAADRWSIGILLLEMAGGMGSFFQALRIDESLAMNPPEILAEQRPLAEHIMDHFGTPGSHGDALACKGDVQSKKIGRKLESLLQRMENRIDLAPF